MSTYPHICIPHVCDTVNTGFCALLYISTYQLWFVDKDTFKLISLQCSVTDNNITKTISQTIVYHTIILKLEVSKIVHSSSIT